MKTAVIIMSRLPEPGFTKTRLLDKISGEECAEFHRACLRDICRVARKTEMPAFLYYIGSGDRPAGGDCDIWGLTAEDNRHLEFCRQKGTNLGERMLNAAHEVMTGYDGVIFLGSDMPCLTPYLLREANERLHDHDLVIGPANDGGYYLLGLKKVYLELFAGIPWGSGNVLHLTMQAAEKLGLSCCLLPVHSDIDTWNDLESFYEKGLINKEYCDLDAYRYTAKLVEKARQSEG